MTYSTIELDSDVVDDLVKLGFAKLAPDGVHELTEKGNAWLGDWCAKKMEEYADQGFLDNLRTKGL